MTNLIATNNTPRSTYATVSADATRGYAVLDAPEVADLMLQGLRDANALQGVKAEIVYDAPSTRWEIRAIVGAPVDIMEHRGVGRVHSLYLALSGADNGVERIRGSGGAIRARCMNCTKSIAEIPGLKWSRIHKGDVTEIRAMVAAMPAKFGALLTDLRSVWAQASASYYLDSDGGRLSPTEVISRLVYNDIVPHGGMTPDEAYARYTQAYAAEDHPSSAAGIIMAIQRAAHESTWTTKWSTVEIEDAAAEMLYQPNYTLDAVNA